MNPETQIRYEKRMHTACLLEAKRIAGSILMLRSKRFIMVKKSWCVSRTAKLALLLVGHAKYEYASGDFSFYCEWKEVPVPKEKP
jgi:hypothetical protein